MLPPLTAAGLAVAVERVKLYGQRTPIEVLDGEIVAGLEEHAACMDAKVKPKTTKIKEPHSLVEYVCRRNVGRHYSTLDRACVAVLAQEQFKKLGREPEANKDIRSAEVEPSTKYACQGFGRDCARATYFLETVAEGAYEAGTVDVAALEGTLGDGLAGLRAHLGR